MNNTIINRLLITDKCIKFDGFDEINDIVIFCFYPTGIVIMSDFPKHINECHVLARLNGNRAVCNKDIVNKLLTRGLSHETIFAKHLTSYYELNPTTEK